MLSKHHRDSPPLAKASRWNVSKFVVIKHFGWESLNVQPSCCLDVVVYMLNYVFWRHILLEIEFKSRVDMGSDSNRYSVQRYSPWAAAQLSTPKKNFKKTKKKQKRGMQVTTITYLFSSEIFCCSVPSILITCLVHPLRIYITSYDHITSKFTVANDSNMTHSLSKNCFWPKDRFSLSEKDC